MDRFMQTMVIAFALALPVAGLCDDGIAKSGKQSAEKVFKVSELFKERASLNKHVVTVKGKVVKVSTGIMDRNWIHLQDGSGNPARKDNDLTVTTSQDLPAVGKVVTMSGTLAKDKDFGSGYFYPVIVENATIKH